MYIVLIGKEEEEYFFFFSSSFRVSLSAIDTQGYGQKAVRARCVQLCP